MLVRFIFDEFYVYRTLCLHFIQLLSNCPRNRTREADFIHRQVEMILPGVSFIQFLDFYFPFFVFFYGLVGYFVLEVPLLADLAQKRMPSQSANFEKHRRLALLSLYVGGFWSLQNLWFS